MAANSVLNKIGVVTRGVKLYVAVVWAGLFTIGLIWASLFFYCQTIYDEQISSIYRENSTLVKSFELHVRHVLQEADSSLLFIKEEYEEGDFETVRGYLKNSFERPDRIQIAIADDSGNIIASSISTQTSILDRDYFTAHVTKSAGLYISKSVINRITGKVSMLVSRRLDNKDGSFGGVVFLAVDPFEFIRFHDSMDLRQSQGLNLVGLDGIIRARRIGSSISYGQDMGFGTVFNRLKEARVGNYIDVMRIDGIERFVSYRAMDDYPLVTLANVETRDALRWYYDERTRASFAAVVATILAVIITVSLYHFLRRYELLNHRYETVVNQSLDAIVLVDKDTNSVIEVNPSYLNLTGFSYEEAIQFTVFDVFEDKSQEHEYLSALACKGRLHSRVQYLKTKDGHVCEVERTAVIIRQEDRDAYLFSLRDVTQERRLERAIHKDVRLAGQMQKSLLPTNYSDGQLEIRILFSPLTEVSGDFLNYKWNSSTRILRGYLCDVTGHGITTALQTAAVRVVLDEVLNDELSLQSLQHVNDRLQQYLDEGNFIALLMFEFDFNQETLKLVTGGINYILASSGETRGTLTLQGGYIGMFSNPDINMSVFPIQPGDKYYFCSDGLLDLLRANRLEDLSDFDKSVRELDQLSLGLKRYDDCSAFCVRIKDGN